MTEFKGTPGPWCLAETESSVSYDCEDGPQLTSWQDIGVFETGAAVAIVLGFDEERPGRDPVSDANARLIAAAPELLHALTELLAACEEDCGVPDEGDGNDEAVGASAERETALKFGHLRRARAAVTKALGE